jgi:hypothetical protein
MSTPRKPPMEPMHQEAEKAACVLLGRPLDRVIAGSFVFTHTTLRPDDLAVTWTEIWKAGPQPRDMRSFRWFGPGAPGRLECERILSQRETFDQAPEISRWLGHVDAQDRELKSAFRS